MTRLEWAFQSYDNTLKFVKLVREEIVLRLVTAMVLPKRDEMFEWINSLIVAIGGTEQPQEDEPVKDAQVD